MSQSSMLNVNCSMLLKGSKTPGDPIAVPCDRAGTFESQIIGKGERRFTSFGRDRALR